MATVERIIDEANLESFGAYTSVGNYPHEEMLRLVTSASSIMDIPAEILMRQFGRELFPLLYESHPQFQEAGLTGAPLLLANIQDHIHLEVTKLYPDSNPPVVSVESKEGRLEVKYESHRPFAYVALGLIEGCYEYFGESAEIQFDSELGAISNQARFVITDSPEG